MLIPWRYPLDALDLRQTATEPPFGTLIVEPFAALDTAATGSQQATFTISMGLVDGKYRIPDPSQAPDPLTLVVQGNYASSTYNINKVVDSSVDFGGTDQAASGEAKLAIPADNPNVAANPVPMVRRGYHYISNVSQVNFAEDLQPRSGLADVTTSPCFNSADLSITRLASIPTYFGRFTVDAGDSVGDIKFVTRVTPTAQVFNLGYNAEFNPTLLCYLSLPFTYWRGTMVYKFIAVTSQAHNVRLGFVSNYNKDFAIPDLKEAYGQYAEIVTFDTTCTEFDIEVPFLTNMAKKRVLKGFASDSTPFSVGTLTARIYNALQAPETVAQSIDFLVFVSMKDASFTNISAGPADFTQVEVG
jgi:hypothetical protein